MSAQFTSIRMPKVYDEALSVAYAQDGELGIALANFRARNDRRVMLIDAAGHRTLISVPDSTEIEPRGSDGFLVGSWRPYSLSGSGLAKPLLRPGIAIGTTGEPQSPALLMHSRIAFIAVGGIEEFSVATSVRKTSVAATISAALMTVPNIRCVPVQPPPGGLPDGHKPKHTGVCVRPAIQVMTSDAQGNLWIVSPSTPDIVELLKL